MSAQQNYMQQYSSYPAQQPQQQQMYPGVPGGGINPAALMGGQNPNPMQPQYNGMGGPTTPQKYPGQPGAGGFGQPQTPQQSMMMGMNGGGGGGGFNINNMTPQMLQQLQQQNPAQYQQVVNKLQQQQYIMQQQRAQLQGGYPTTPQNQQHAQAGFDPRTAMMQQQQQQQQQHQQPQGSPAPQRPGTAMGQASNGSFIGPTNGGYGTPTGYGGQQQMQSYMGAGSPAAAPAPGTPVQPSHQSSHAAYAAAAAAARTGTPQIPRPPTVGPGGRSMSPAVATPASAGGPDQSPMIRGAKRKASELGDGFAASPPPPDVKVEASAPGQNISPVVQRRSGLGTSQTPARAPSLAPAPALPSHVQQELTKVTSVRLAGSDNTIPPLSAEQIADVKGWLARDTAYLGELRGMRERMGKELVVSGARRAAQWWEVSEVPNAADALKARNELARRQGRSGANFNVVYPNYKWQDHQNGKKAKGQIRFKNRLLPLPRTLSVEASQRQEWLVPIRLELDVIGMSGQKFRETFTWNMNDPIVDPTVFAKGICDDFLMDDKNVANIVKAMEDQFSEFRSSIIVPTRASTSGTPDDGMVRGRLGPADEQWWSDWRQSLRTKKGTVRRKQKPVKGDEDGDADVEMEEPVVAKKAASKRRNVIVLDEGEDEETARKQKETEKKQPTGPQEEDLRITVHLDILIGAMNLKDQFEWDVANPDNSPEQFAAVYCADLGIGGEFKSAIAHTIREQTQVHLKSLAIVGHPMDGSVIQEEEVRQMFLPPISVAARSFDQTSTFSPMIEYLSDGDIDRAEKERDKELKRKRRATKGKRAIALPDRDPVRTHRTPAIGFPEIDTATLPGGGILPTSSRRAAAAAASATIASMVANENRPEHDDFANGGMQMQMQSSTPMQSQQTPQAPAIPVKVSRIRGSFKPPLFAQQAAVENPRASMTKTPSTAYGGERENKPARNRTGAGATTGSEFHKKQPEPTEESNNKVADGQHPNMINGIWHCSNCGIPDDIAIGRRKGPNGLKSQCGTCGKWWHQHRKLRPVEYTTDREHHLRVLRDANNRNRRNRGGGGRDNASPSKREKVEEKPVPVRAVSPSSMSSMSNQSEDLPLSRQQRARAASRGNGNANGHGHSKQEPTGRVKPEPVQVDGISHVGPMSAAGETPTGGHLYDPQSAITLPIPKWLEAAVAELQNRYEHDKFVVIQRIRGPMESGAPPADEEMWRLKCIDCPGKLYKPGPEESLTNFEVHLRNRLHRQKVGERCDREQNPQSEPAESVTDS